MKAIHRRLALGLAAATLLASTTTLPVYAEPDEPLSPAQVASAEAAGTGQSVEVTEWTNENSLTRANPNGTFTLESSREAVRARTDEGTWAAIDTTIEHSGHRLTPRLTATDMDFSTGGDNALATTHVEDGSLTVETPFTLTTPIIDGPAITYPDVMPDIDLVVTVTADAYSQVLVVKNATAAANPALTNLPFTVVTTEGLDYTVNDDGSSQATNADGETVLESSAPYMWDSTPTQPGAETPDAQTPGDNVAAIPVETTPQITARGTTTDNHRTDVILTPPAQSLSGHHIDYPVYIDPPMSRPRLTFVVTREGLTSYVSGDDFRVGYCNWTGCSPYYRARTYFNFDISALNQPTGGPIGIVTDAKITLSQTHSAGSAATAVQLARTTSTFGGWTGWPGPLGSALATASTKSGDTNIQFASADLTAYVNSLVYHQADQAGFALRAVNESDPYAWKKFNNSPTLTITYGFASSIPTALGLTNTTTCRDVRYVNGKSPVFAAKARTWDPAGSLVKVRFSVYKSTGTPVATYVSNAVGANITATATATDLPDGHYYVKAQSEPAYTDVTAANFRSAYSGQVNFTVDTAPVTEPSSVWSTTHPTGAQFSSNRPGAINIEAADAGTLGFYYSWTGTVPTNTTTQCTDPSTTNSASGFALASGGTATLQIPSTVGDGATGILEIRTVGRTGTFSPEKIYELKVNAAGTTVTTIESETIVVEPDEDGASSAVTTDPRASNGSKLTVTSPAGGSITFKFTPTSTTQVIQPDLNLPTGKTVTFSVNNTPLQTGFYNVAALRYTCQPITATGTGQLTYPRAELTTCNTANGTASAINPGQENTFTITTPTATTYTIDLIRIINL